CQVSLKPKTGPVTAQTMTMPVASRKVVGLPDARAVATASFPNQPAAGEAPNAIPAGRLPRMLAPSRHQRPEHKGERQRLQRRLAGEAGQPIDESFSRG